MSVSITPAALRELAAKCNGRMIIGANVPEINAALIAVAGEVERLERKANPPARFATAEDIRAEAAAYADDGIATDVDAMRATLAVVERERDEALKSATAVHGDLIAYQQRIVDLSANVTRLESELAVAVESAARSALDAEAAQRQLETFKDLLQVENGNYVTTCIERDAAVAELKALKETADAELAELITQRDVAIGERDQARRMLGNNNPSGVVAADAAYEARVADHNAGVASPERLAEIDALTRATLAETPRHPLLAKAGKAIGGLIGRTFPADARRAVVTLPAAVPAPTDADRPGAWEPIPTIADYAQAANIIYVSGDEVLDERLEALHTLELELGRLEAAHHERRLELLERIRALRALLAPLEPASAVPGLEGAPKAAAAPQGAPDA